VTDARPTVLLVDDEVAVTRVYERMLSDRYDVRVANGGDEALSLVDESVDVVLLDRMMPDRSGDSVLAEIRERGLDCGVAMVTAVEPELDIVEMGFDTYLQKPPSRDTLVATIERLLARREYTADLRAYAADLQKLALLRERDDDRSDAARDRLATSIDERTDRLDEAAVALDDDRHFLSVISQIDRQTTTDDTRGGSSA
jgi:DNA-binding response OmpR family regulator